MNKKYLKLDKNFWNIEENFTLHGVLCQASLSSPQLFIYFVSFCNDDNGLSLSRHKNQAHYKLLRNMKYELRLNIV